MQVDSLPTELSGKPKRKDKISHILNGRNSLQAKGRLRAPGKFENSKEAEIGEEGENGGQGLISRPAEGL